MNYTLAMVSEPIRFDQEYSIPIDGAGDSYFLTAVEHSLEFYPDKLEPAETTPLTPKPSVSIVHSKKDFIGYITEGQTLSVPVKLSEPCTADTTVVCDMTFPAMTIPSAALMDEDLNSVNESMDTMSWVTMCEPTDWDAMQASVVIPQGSDSGVVEFTPTMNTDIVNKLKVAMITVTSIDQPDWMINTRMDSGYIVMKESTPFPKWEGSLEVWCRTHKLSHLERVLDPDTSSVSGFNFGWELNADGTLSDVSTLASIQIDDIPLEEIVIKPTSTDGVPDLPVDIESETTGGTAIDLSTRLPLYRIVMFLGRRQ